MKPVKYKPQEERIEMTPEKLRSLLNGIPYPVLVVIAYLLLGFTLNLWHPMWMLFLTVPVYYALANNKVFLELIYSAWQRRKLEQLELERLRDQIEETDTKR
ncbi:MAG: hypothetical protein LBC65_04535 [Oscillospiraceae bacterium]|jgi:hypothetical protein|nr:hypothetical protein [Oscillospiraceae bacterium]